jgi:hypothetical protein
VNNSRPDGDEVIQVVSFRTRSRSLADATRDRLQRSPAGAFARRLAAVGSFESATLFGAALLISVLPFVILLSSLANHRIDTDISRHIGRRSVRCPCRG